MYNSYNVILLELEFWGVNLCCFVTYVYAEIHGVIIEKEMVVFVGPYELVTPEGHNASFFCHGAYGSGNYSYLWFNSDKEVIGNQTSLDISYVTSDMTGEYTCLAYDDTGLEANASVYLIVLSKCYI